MELLKNKLLVFCLIAGALLLVIIWAHSSNKISQDKLLPWITKGYSQQFCTVIYPRIANCVIMPAAQCPAVATAQITDCINAKKDDLPSSVEEAEAKKIYDSFAQCFQNNMHGVILQKYVVQSPECLQQLS